MRNWDQYYSDPSPIDDSPEPLLFELAETLPPGDALDLACGAGRNTLYLARLGWRVTAVDSSPVAIRLLAESGAGLPINARVADLETGEFAIQTAAYDLICDFYYLQRDLFAAIREGVRPGGVVAMAIHLLDPVTGPGAHNPAFLMKPGELRKEFAGWKILFYSEADQPGRSRRVARILARRA